MFAGWRNLLLHVHPLAPLFRVAHIFHGVAYARPFVVMVSRAVGRLGIQYHHLLHVLALLHGFAAAHATHNAFVDNRFAFAHGNGATHHAVQLLRIALPRLPKRGSVL